ncbi:MAG: ATP-dependent DNA helicase [Pseudomonadota bacterium]
MSEPITVSVGDLVALTCLSGDLVNDAAWGPSAVQGIRAHQRYQRNALDANPAVQSEVRLRHRFDVDGVTVSVTGRVDLVYPAPPQATLTEIKSTFTPPERINDSLRNRHWAQLTVYAALHFAQPEHTGEQAVTGQLVWCNLLDDRDTVEERDLTRADADAFVAGALQRLVTWYGLVNAHRDALQRSGDALTFPWGAFRPGQRAFAAHVYRAARDGGQLIAEAPTGTGKTAATVFPAVKALSAGHIRRAVYLTAKTTGRESVDAALGTLRGAGLTICHVGLRAKQQVCPCAQAEFELDPDGRCPRTVGFFDRLPAARDELMRRTALDGDTLDAVADAHTLCPFELALQMLPWVDLAVCDFNYVFDPLVRLSDLAAPTGRNVLLIDEAHNLRERARDMYSAELDTALCARAEADAAGNGDLLRGIRPLARALRTLARDHEPGDTELDGPPPAINRAIERVLSLAGDTLGATLWRGVQGELTRAMLRYQVIAGLYGDDHTTLLSVTADGKRRRVQLRLAALDASRELAASLKRQRASVVFSATLHPIDLTAAQLGLTPDALQLRLPSPFDPAHLRCLVHTGIDPRYQRRDASIAPLVDTVHALYRRRPGNYLVFFPSYAYLDRVFDAFVAAHPDIPTRAQTPGSDATARADFLADFSDTSATLGFAILGGVFGEGVDLIGGRLIGAVLVSTGLPPPTTERKCVEAHLEARGQPGRDVAFTLPAMTRVAQTAGRVIRSESDRGVLLLIDPRFQHAAWQRLMPAHWQPQQVRSLDELDRALDAFWSPPGA